MNLLNNFAASLIPQNTLPKVDANNALANGISIFFGILGAIAFLVIVIAGLNMVLSEGNPDKVSRAKNTIIYAAVGLVIAASASLIVSAVLNKG